MNLETVTYRQRPNQPQLIAALNGLDSYVQFYERCAKLSRGPLGGQCGNGLSLFLENQ